MIVGRKYLSRFSLALCAIYLMPTELGLSGENLGLGLFSRKRRHARHERRELK